MSGSISGALLVGALAYCFCLGRKRKRRKQHSPVQRDVDSAELPTYEEASALARALISLSNDGAVTMDNTPEMKVLQRLSDSQRSQNTDGIRAGSTLTSLSEDEPIGEGCGGRISVMKDALSAVVDSARAVAEKSSMPFVPEIASFLAVLASLCSNFGGNEQNMPRTVRWCGSMLEMLDQSSIHMDDSGPVTELLEEVRDAIAEIVKERQETAKTGLRDALQRLQTGVAFVSMNVLHRTSTSVDSLARRVGPEGHISRKERKKRMMECHEIPSGEVICFDDMILGTGGYSTVQLVGYQETAAAAKLMQPKR
ncbi:unnamed protein product [Ectocarpus sp. CCAP 1310/34]|nr:unnamed protein product [Ectocarpus sp. CCAP 1310/34]